MDAPSDGDETTQGYSPSEDRPLRGYVFAMASYGALVAGLAGVGRSLGAKLPKRIEPYDFGLAVLATHKVSRLLTKDSVTSPLRAPFVRYKEPAGAGELNEEVRSSGGLHALGELITCPFCVAVWVATGFIGGLAIVPRATRLAATTFSVVGLSDALQFGYDALKSTDE